MSATKTEVGIDVSGLNFAGAANDQARVQLLIDALPDPDGPQANQGAAARGLYFDQMSPMCAASLLKTLRALKAAVS